MSPLRNAGLTHPQAEQRHARPTTGRRRPT
jgi:hypothetical protein